MQNDVDPVLTCPPPLPSASLHANIISFLYPYSTLVQIYDHV